MDAYIKDRNGTVYIGIRNFYNSFCYYISVVQRLHSSRTLGSLLLSESLSSTGEQGTLDSKILEILKIYAGITESNIKETYDKMLSFENVIKEVINPRLHNGGSPDETMKFLFLPVIFRNFEQSFTTILEEINFNPIHFSGFSSMFDSKFVLTNYPEFNNGLKKTYEDMYSCIKKYVFEGKTPFNITVMSVYFKDEENKRSSYSGHAINIVRSLKDIYVIDDDINIRTFNNYIQNARNSILEIEIKDVDDDTLKMIKTSQNLEINKRIYRTVIKPSGTASMSGGTLAGPNPLTLLLIGVVLLLLIVISIIKLIKTAKVRTTQKKIESYVDKIKNIEDKVTEIENRSSVYSFVQPKVPTTVIDEWMSVPRPKINRHVGVKYQV